MGGPPLNPTETLLSSMVAWWDAPSYIGSGPLLNKGTIGSFADLTISGPTFASGVFTFDGIDDEMSAVTGNTYLDCNTGESISVGVVVNHDVAPNSYGIYCGKKNGSIGWLMYSNASAIQAYCKYMGYSFTAISPNPGSTGVPILLTFVRNTSTLQILSGSNISTSSPTSDTASGNQANTGLFTIGSAALQNKQKFKLIAAFFHRGILTTQNLTDICTYYGITP